MFLELTKICFLKQELRMYFTWARMELDTINFFWSNFTNTQHGKQILPGVTHSSIPIQYTHSSGTKMPISLIFLLCCILGTEGSQMGAPTQDRTVFKKEDFYYYSDDCTNIQSSLEECEKVIFSFPLNWKNRGDMSLFCSQGSIWRRMSGPHGLVAVVIFYFFP